MIFKYINQKKKMSIKLIFDFFNQKFYLHAINHSKK